MSPAGRPARLSPTALVLRALRSTAIITVVALLFAALRQGRFEWIEIKTALQRHWPLGPAVFFGVLIWDAWFQRSRRPRIVDDLPPY